MTIKQHGGIFGRNPTFNNVTVDGTLTVDQIVEKTGAAGITLDGVTLKDGNVVLADGKGIDFSATAGAGTSELFDDYEEGTWTAQLADSNTGTINYSPTTATGHYTKIGNIVHVSVSGWNNIDTTGMTSTNALYMTLPFSGVLPHSVGSAVLNTFDFNTGSQVVIQSFYANALFYTNTDNASQSTLRVNDITSGVSDIAAISLTYRVS